MDNQTQRHDQFRQHVMECAGLSVFDLNDIQETMLRTAYEAAVTEAARQMSIAAKNAQQPNVIDGISGILSFRDGRRR